MMDAAPELLAERQAGLDALGPRPPWWRLFARRRWKREHARIMQADVSSAALMLRSIYTAEHIKELVTRPAPVFAMLTKELASGESLVKPVTRESDAMEMRVGLYANQVVHHSSWGIPDITDDESE